MVLRLRIVAGRPVFEHSGLVSGTPTAAGAFSFNVKVTDSTGATATSGLSITVSGVSGTLSILTASLPDANTGASYSQSLFASGGTPPYTWEIINGTMPGGLTLSTSGVISGKPTSPGTYFLRFSVTDSAADSVVRPLFLTVISSVGPLNIDTASLPGGTVGVSYGQSLSASGGTPPYIWKFASGSLPNGLFLSTAGAISGTPTAAGTFTFAFTVTDTSGAIISSGLSILVKSPPVPLVIATVSLTPPVSGSLYTQSLSATGGTGPDTWTLVSGSLPAGLTLSSSGVISRTPTSSGTFNITVRVNDAAGAAATTSLSITVAPAATTSTTPPVSTTVTPPISTPATSTATQPPPVTTTGTPPSTTPPVTTPGPGIGRDWTYYALIGAVVVLVLILIIVVSVKLSTPVASRK